MLLTIKDETFAGKILNEIQIELKSETVTVKEIIESRVKQEVESYNKSALDKYKGLIQPNEAEEQLNGYKLKKGKKIDVEKQIYVALNAFNTNGFFLLVDDLQVESLEQEIHVNSSMNVSFIKLTPLIGG